MTHTHTRDNPPQDEQHSTPVSYGRLALVEDDVALSDLTRQYLTREGFEVLTVADGLQAPERIQAWNPDLVILDIMLPGQDGLEVCRQIQRFYQGPILFLTARGESLDEILGLELGADDYLTKPVEPRVLLARIKAHLRRSRRINDRPGAGDGALLDWLNVDKRNLKVTCQGRDVELTQPEFNLLCLLYDQPGVIHSRDDIMQSLRGIEYDGVSRTVDILVSGIRQKLGLENAIRTVRGKGYLLVESPF
ncbi:response regulator transcription factor [Saccharospirillum impatiens]|uniref:response regulator transcription factor n=1 Tax=Saccharospirillum impatiens TaxID=169438 RepID=UPI000404A60B|nr:response regulator transcription factor [Saccharospirillum impatiens]